MTTPTPLLTVTYTDIGIKLTTRGGAEVTMPPGDAADLAAALMRAVEDFHAHRQMIDAIDDIDGGIDTLGA